MTTDDDKDSKFNTINEQQADFNRGFFGRHSKLLWAVIVLAIVYFAVSGADENEAKRPRDFQYSSEAKADILKLINATGYSCTRITSASNRLLSEKVDVQCSNGARFDVYKHGGKWVVEATD